MRNLILFVAALVVLAWSASSAWKQIQSEPVQKLFSATEFSKAKPPRSRRADTLQEPVDLSTLKPIDFVALELRFGTPDLDSTTADDNPRPRLVTRTMIFKRHRLKLVMALDERAGDAPRKDRWLFVSLQDPKTNNVLDDDEVHRRLAASDR